MSGKQSVISLFVLFVFLAACSGSQQTETQKTEPPSPYLMNFSNIATVPDQVLPPSRIQSIQLERIGDPSAPPVIRLNSRDRLLLSFDEMSNESHMFTVKITHHNRDWGQSSLLPIDYLGNMSQDQITDGRASSVQNPSYTHYKYEFPNNTLTFLVSGNYMLHIYDYDTGKELFSLPFFVSENRNLVTTRVETLYNEGPASLQYHQLFSSYHYPDFVKFPQFNLHVVYAQNRFWGRARKADIYDISQPGVLDVHNSRNNLFVANYGFLDLNLQSFQQPQYGIVTYRPETTPPTVILRTDTPSLSTASGIRPFFKFGQIDNHSDAQYLRVHFSLNGDKIVDPNASVYLIGSFNNWSIQSGGKMNYDPSSGLFKGAVEIKQGKYNYKYAVVEGNKINDLRLDTNFASTRQEYVVFVYYRDQTRQYDRLLVTNDFFSH
ncbi:MAG TPA: type IX secretion system plug protein domain-containing protein [Balneolales bacterium]|nr:type IX secretion system plug protein domain-containing protein [Balneolales bacterium]